MMRLALGILVVCGAAYAYPYPDAAPQPMPVAQPQPMPYPGPQPMPYPYPQPMPMAYPGPQPMPYPAPMPMPSPAAMPDPYLPQAGPAPGADPRFFGGLGEFGGYGGFERGFDRGFGGFERGFDRGFGGFERGFGRPGCEEVIIEPIVVPGSYEEVVVGYPYY